MTRTAGNVAGLRPVYVVDGARTPFLKARGVRGPFSAADLAVAAGRSLLLRQPLEPPELDEVIIGCVIPDVDETNIARVVSLRLGCGKKVPAWTVNRNCASGMQALDCAFKDISTGRADLVLAGGTEAMSRAYVLVEPRMQELLSTFMSGKSLAGKIKGLLKFRPSFLMPVIGLLRGLTDPVVGLSMGQTAENLAHRFGISRAEMDSFSVQSHERLAAAMDGGRMGEIEPVFDAAGNLYDADSGLRRDTNMEKLGKLKPVFDRPVGDVTAGNSAQVTDGAALLLLASADAVRERGLPVLGRIVDTAWAGVDPSEMGLGPVHSMAPLMKRNNLSAADIDCWEINEAFAAQVLACLKAWDDPEYFRRELDMDAHPGSIDASRLNIDGGAVSIGHPVGASGARIVLHLLRILEREKWGRGIASLCIGGGQGGAMLVERVEGV